MATGKKLAVCDPVAFYPFRRLVEGPLTNRKDLEAAERFIRTVVLHDELVMGLEPLPLRVEDDEALRKAAREKAAIAAAAGKPFAPGEPVVLGIAFTETSLQEDKYGYGLFAGNLSGQSPPNIELSPSQLEMVSTYSHAKEGNPHYTSHLHYLQHLFNVVLEGGSLLCEDPFARAAIERATQFPSQLFVPLDADWKQYVQKIQSGSLGLVVPPLLSIVLNNCARRDAIPEVVMDLRRDWGVAREKIWQLVEEQRSAQTLRELNEVDHAFAEASKHFSPTTELRGTSPLRMLWDILAAATSGAVTAKLVGADAKIGALTGATPQIIRSVKDAPSLFRRGAFDLAGRVRDAAASVAPMPDLLSRFLSDSEKRALGYPSPN
jgi:hypothetical protein